MGVGVRHSVDAAGNRSAGFSGLQTCGSVYSCPTCNHKIATERAAEVAQAIRTWEASDSARYVSMVTLTMRHHDGQLLSTLWDALTYAWSKTTSGRGWKDLQSVYGTINLTGKGRRIPWVRFVEVTHGSNGWHVHVHSLLFLEDRPSLFADDDVYAGMTDDQAIGRNMFDRWRSALVRKGLDAPIRGRGGLDVTRFSPGAEELGQYLTKATYEHADKAGWEAAGGSMKDARHGNRTPFAILRAIVAAGDADDLDLWHEWEIASQGRRQVGWARGFRQWLALEDEKTDQEIAAEELDGETLGWFDAAQWASVRGSKADLLAAAETLPLAFLRSAPPTIWLNEYRTRYKPRINWS